MLFAYIELTKKKLLTLIYKIYINQYILEIPPKECSIDKKYESLYMEVMGQLLFYTRKIMLQRLHFPFKQMSNLQEESDHHGQVRETCGKHIIQPNGSQSDYL